MFCVLSGALGGRLREGGELLIELDVVCGRVGDGHFSFNPVFILSRAAAPESATATATGGAAAGPAAAPAPPPVVAAVVAAVVALPATAALAAQPGAEVAPLAAALTRGGGGGGGGSVGRRSTAAGGARGGGGGRCARARLFHLQRPSPNVLAMQAIARRARVRRVSKFDERVLDGRPEPSLFGGSRTPFTAPYVSNSSPRSSSAKS